jgi:glycosyltransferase involved in cell wall biosynthesis
MNNALVSILIPVYNRQDIVGETIESALAQTYANTEIIIVDNCSTDNTWGILERFENNNDQIKIFKNDENLGPVLNWKRCIDEAKGEYAKILFSDDLISENFIEETLAFFDQDTAFVLSRIACFQDDKKKHQLQFDHSGVIKREDYLNDILLYNNLKFPVSPGNAIFRLKDLKTALEVDIVNELNLNFKTYGAGNDLLIYLNIANSYSSVKVSKEAISFFRRHRESFSISNNLLIYYDFSKYYFINLNFPKDLSKFKTILWLRGIRYKNRNKVIDLIDKRINISFLLNVLIKKLLN